MKYCYECGRVTAGEPLFCSFCGRTYNAKLCPRMHTNPRSADVCSQCGSRELSTPQPKVPISWRVLEWLARTFFGVLFGILSLIFGIALLEAVLESPQLQTGVIVLAVLLGVLWWLWSQLPEWFRKLVRRALERRRNREGR